MEFEAWLKRPEELDRKLYNLEEKIAILRSRAEKSTSVLSPAPGGSSCNDSRLEELVIKIADLEKEEARMEHEMAGVSAELSTFLSRLSSPVQMKILMMHYVELMSFDDIARKFSLPVRSMYRYHKEGLAEARALYDAEHAGQSGE